MASLFVGQPMHDAADGQAQKAIDLAHPVGVALGEIVVDGDDMDAFAGQRIQIDGQRGDECFAFAGLHLGDVAVVQHHAADQLDVEMALAERPLGRLADGRKSFRQDVFQVSPSARRSLKAGVMAASSSSDLALNAGSSALISATGQYRLSFPLVGRTEETLRNRA